MANDLITSLDELGKFTGHEARLLHSSLHVALEREAQLQQQVKDLEAEIERLNHLRHMRPRPDVSFESEPLDCSKGAHDWEYIPNSDQAHRCRSCGTVSGK